MKKALNLIVIYFLTLLIGLSVGTIVYSFYINVLNFVAGTEIKFFSERELFDAFFYVGFCVLFIICLFITYYRIRHPGGLYQIIAYACLALITWTLLIPGFAKLSNKYEMNFPRTEKVKLSKDYFRQAGDKVYYFTKDFKMNEKGQMVAPAIVIDLNNNGIVKFEDVVDSKDFELVKASEPYREVLVKNTFSRNKFPLSIKFRNIIATCEANINNGFLPFLGYLSLGFALCSLFALTCLFQWNLLNTMFITTFAFFILLYNSNPMFLSFEAFKQRVGNNVFCKIISNFGTEPLVFLLNFFLAIVFIGTGVIVYLVRKRNEDSF